MDKIMMVIEIIDKAAKTVSHVIKAWEDVERRVDKVDKKKKRLGR